MRVWTNGTLHLARLGRRLFLFKGSQFFRHFDLEAGDSDHDELLAVAPSGSHAWLAGLRRLSLDDGSLGPAIKASVVDAVSLDDERVVALLGGPGKSPLRLALGAPGSWERELPLAHADVARAELPPAIWPAVARYDWSDEGLSSGQGRSLRLGAGPHGQALACSRSGLIALLRQGQGLRWLRAPSLPSARIDAALTEQGVLVTVSVGREAVAAHLSDDGRLLSHTGPTAQSVGAAPLQGGRFALFDDTKQGRVKVYDVGSCQDMHPRARLSLPQPPLDASSSHDGRWVVFGGGDYLSIFELGDKRLSLVASVRPEEALREAAAKAREKQRIEQGAQYRRTEGPPALGFPASKAPVVPWESPPGLPFELSLSLRSTGSAGRGVVVEISGPALAEGLVAPRSVALGGQQKPLVQQGSSWVATLDSVEIPCGMVFPFDPKPKSPEQSEKAQALLAATHLDLKLQLAAQKIGAAMLSVSVRPLGGSSAPMKWTRPVTIQIPPPPAPPQAAEG